MRAVDGRITHVREGDLQRLIVAPQPGILLPLARLAEAVTSGLHPYVSMACAPLVATAGLGVLLLDQDPLRSALPSLSRALAPVSFPLGAALFGAAILSLVATPWAWWRASRVELELERDTARIRLWRRGRKRSRLVACGDAHERWPVVTSQFSSAGKSAIMLPRDSEARRLALEQEGGVRRDARAGTFVVNLVTTAALHDVVARGLSREEAERAIQALGAMPAASDGLTTLRRLKRTLEETPPPWREVPIPGGVLLAWRESSRTAAGLACDGTLLGVASVKGERITWEPQYRVGVLDDLGVPAWKDGYAVDPAPPRAGQPWTSVAAFTHLERPTQLGVPMALRPWDAELALFQLARASPRLAERLRSPALRDAALLARGEA